MSIRDYVIAAWLIAWRWTARRGRQLRTRMQCEKYGHTDTQARRVRSDWPVQPAPKPKRNLFDGEFL